MGNVESSAVYRKKMLAVTEREAKLEKKLKRKERYEQSFIPVIAIDTIDAILEVKERVKLPKKTRQVFP